MYSCDYCVKQCPGYKEDCFICQCMWQIVLCEWPITIATCETCFDLSIDCNGIVCIVCPKDLCCGLFISVFDALSIVKLNCSYATNLLLCSSSVHLKHMIINSCKDLTRWRRWRLSAVAHPICTVCWCSQASWIDSMFLLPCAKSASSKMMRSP